MKTIDRFKGQYYFLSNFYFVEIEVDGFTFHSVEHAFQASKAPKSEWHRFSNISSGRAKTLGRMFTLPSDWEVKKIFLMRNLLTIKFKKGSDLAERLIETEKATLIEGNDWGDKFWGVCNGTGRNMLGLLLMGIRAELRDEKENPFFKKAQL